eukprot:1337411-Amorphochlora_amoeboformis.AAC.1
MAVPGNPTPVLVVGPGAETFTSQVVASSGGETKVVIDGKSVKFLSFPVMVKGWDSMVEGCAGAVIASTPDAKEASIAEWRAVVEAKISGPVEYVGRISSLLPRKREDIDFFSDNIPTDDAYMNQT